MVEFSSLELLEKNISLSNAVDFDQINKKAVNLFIDLDAHKKTCTDCKFLLCNTAKQMNLTALNAAGDVLNTEYSKLIEVIEIEKDSSDDGQNFLYKYIIALIKESHDFLATLDICAWPNDFVDWQLSKEFIAACFTDAFLVPKDDLKNLFEELSKHKAEYQGTLLAFREALTLEDKYKAHTLKCPLCNTIPISACDDAVKLFQDAEKARISVLNSDNGKALYEYHLKLKEFVKNQVNSISNDNTESLKFNFSGQNNPSNFQQASQEKKVDFLGKEQLEKLSKEELVEYSLNIKKEFDNILAVNSRFRNNLALYREYFSATIKLTTKIYSFSLCDEAQAVNKITDQVSEICLDDLKF